MFSAVVKQSSLHSCETPHSHIPTPHRIPHQCPLSPSLSVSASLPVTASLPISASLPVSASLPLPSARGYVCSSLDPVTGGVHCSLGGGPHDFLVTSTLASQCPPAVGRALAVGLTKSMKVPTTFPEDMVSFVSVGDGSVNNAHFLSAVNMAEYAQHRKFKCPVVFGISDNQLCISLRGYNWLSKFLEQRLGMQVQIADGNDVCDIAEKTKAAVAYSRRYNSPSAVV